MRGRRKRPSCKCTVKLPSRSRMATPPTIQQSNLRVRKTAWTVPLMLGVRSPSLNRIIVCGLSPVPKSPSRVRFRQIGNRSHDAKLGDPQRSAGCARTDVTRLAGKIGVEMSAEIAGGVAGAVDLGALSEREAEHM